MAYSIMVLPMLKLKYLYRVCFRLPVTDTQSGARKMVPQSLSSDRRPADSDRRASVCMELVGTIPRAGEQQQVQFLDWVVPPDAQDSIGNAFDNIGFPHRFLNDIFQGKFKTAFFVEMIGFSVFATLTGWSRASRSSVLTPKRRR